MKQLRWKRILLMVGIGLVFFLIVNYWRIEQQMKKGWCVLFFPDGTEKIAFGQDCFPNQ